MKSEVGHVNDIELKTLTHLFQTLNPMLYASYLVEVKLGIQRIHSLRGIIS